MMRFIFSSAVLVVLTALSHCTDIDRCEVGSEGCVCGKNDSCREDLTCSDEPRADDGDPEDRGICLPATCLETCKWKDDGSCDDGGEGSNSDKCDWGTDCSDCKPRFGDPPGEPLCSNSCRSAGDGTCDDGGMGSIFETCAFGTDCLDCGPRYHKPICLNSCKTAEDGFCDDGGENSDYDSCDWGTDCQDCGPRYGDAEAY
ncbi:MAG: hypothetical protein JXA30_18385 [Deltaproteobacteria bacterium]|nr:hypothetical protein [Deltaproteobacteria bacterium]